MQDIATAMSVDIARLDHYLGLIHPQTDANYESLVLITAKINLCEKWQHQAAHDERDLRSRLSLAEANLSSYFVLIEQAFSHPRLTPGLSLPQLVLWTLLPPRLIQFKTLNYTCTVLLRWWKAINSHATRS